MRRSPSDESMGYFRSSLRDRNSRRKRQQPSCLEQPGCWESLRIVGETQSSTIVSVLGILSLTLYARPVARNSLIDHQVISISHQR